MIVNTLRSGELLLIRLPAPLPARTGRSLISLMISPITQYRKLAKSPES
jgi:hypothetical protein